ncbi:MAG: ABC transporter permease [bacterium]|nr:ABC transporter permease [bacterium]
MNRSRGQTWNLIWMLAQTDFKLRYQGSVLGFLWALLKPLFVFAILNLVFSHLFASSVEHYSLQLLMGILMWNFFAEGTSVGLTALMTKAHILTKIPFPRWIVIVAASLQSLMSFFINILIFFGAFVLFGVPIALWQLFAFVFYLVLLYVIVLGFSFFASPLFVRFRDLNQIWEVLLTGGFYAAPIIYPLRVLPEWLQPWMYLNPMTFLIEHSKGVLFSGLLSRADHHAFYVSVVVLGFVLALGFFRKFERRVVEFL